MIKANVIDESLLMVLGLLAAAGTLFAAFAMDSVMVAILAILLSLAVMITGGILVVRRRHVPQRLLSAGVAIGAALILVGSVGAKNWPLRVGYEMSRDSFDAVAERVRKGEPVTAPMRVGFFTIERAELSGRGIVCLWTHVASGGNTGFVQCPPDHVPFNLWSIVRLDNRWQFISED
jgi:drug/metabolite transporter (DMT)-like permease